MNEALLIELNKNIQELNEKLKFTHKEVFNAKEAAEYLTIGYDTVLRLARIDDIEHIKNGTNYIFRKEHLDRWLDKQERRAE